MSRCLDCELYVERIAGLEAERDLLKRQLDKVDEVLDWQHMKSDEAHAFTVGRIFCIERLQQELDAARGALERIRERAGDSMAPYVALKDIYYLAEKALAGAAPQPEERT